MTKKKVRRKSKKAEGPKMGAVMDPSRAWWTQERYVKRRTAWMWRLRPFLRDKSEQCNTCVFKNKCHRIPLNERLTAKIAQGKKCPDYKSIWKKILTDDEPHDWGF